MLETLDLSRSLTKEEYIHDLIRYQVALQALGYQVYVQKRPVIIVYEGADAGGKGGNIKRVTEKLDPRGYVVQPVAAPQGEDKTHHYLWRFWRRLPERGQITIFDRSWYGRVMVERIEGFCTEDEWKRAYREINHFERQLVDFGTILFKFYIHIGKEEQLQRFKAREETAYKAWKLTDEDWRNRDKWDEYVVAVDEMLRRTSTLTAPWTLVEGNCKWYARVKVLRTLVEGLSHELGVDPFAEIPPIPKAKAERKKKRKKKKKKSRKGASGKGKKKRSKTDVAEAQATLPMIDQFEFQRIVLDGKEHKTDVIVLPNGIVEPWEHQDEHRVGADDLDRIIQAQPELLIVGTGTAGNLKVPPEATKMLQEAGIEAITHRTFKAIETYKELRQQRVLAALFHITC